MKAQEIQHVEDATACDGDLSAEDQDKVLRVLQQRPWITPQDIAESTRLLEDDIQRALEDLVEEDVVDQVQDAYAIHGTKRPPTTRYKTDRMGESADELEQIVRENPWKPARFYAEKKGTHRNGAYNQLDNLTERGRITMTVHEGVKHWGPSDEDPPEGHMTMRPGARSPIRQALKPRIKALLKEDPWQTTSTITERLEANRKSVGNALRSLLHHDELIREPVKWQGKRDVWAYSPQDSRPLSEDDEDRIQDEQEERLPDHYGTTQDRVKRFLKRVPWSTARRIQDGLSNTTMGGVQAALGTLRDRNEITRVADGEYRYAIVGTKLTRNVTGSLDRGGKTSKQLDTAVEVLEERKEATTKELRELLQERLEQKCTGVHHQLKRGQEKGVLDSYKATRNGTDVRVWRIHEDHAPEASDLIGQIEHAAHELREQGWTVNVSLEEPDEEGA